MEWSALLSSERLKDPKYVGAPNRSIFVQDHDRIVFSAPFRRLANKTQVHPLYDNDHIHHRLIHSIEVSSVGRSLAVAIGLWLVEKKLIEAGEEHSLGNIVQAACVAHDIGNPPFGHSGEDAIGTWFAERFDQKDGILADLSEDLRTEFTAFEGNAQGFRILSRLEMYRNAGGMRLSKGTLGAFTKYPVTAETRHFLTESEIKNYVGLKKFGVFASELPLFEEIAKSLGLPRTESAVGTWWRRHPLVFIVEAADDICYNIVDLEDAFTSGDLAFEVVREKLDVLAGRPNRDVSGYSQAEHIAFLRALAIGAAVNGCVEAFKENYDAIMAGSFSQSLISASGKAEGFSGIETLAHERIFTSRRKTELEVSGRRVIRNVLDGVLPVYENLALANWDAGQLKGPYAQLVRAVSLDMRGISSVYEALHGLTDFVSGMTDRYALKVSRMLSGT